MMMLEDSYPESNQSSFTQLFSEGDLGYGQSFTASFSGLLARAVFHLKKENLPTGNAVAKLYAHTGTYGSSSLPDGEALATSEPFDVSTLTTSFALVSLDFVGVNQYTLVSGVHYVITFEWSGSGSGHKIDLGRDFSSPTHDGNGVEFAWVDGFWQYIPGADVIFYVFAFPECVHTFETSVKLEADDDTNAAIFAFDMGIYGTNRVRVNPFIADPTYGWTLNVGANENTLFVSTSNPRGDGLFHTVTVTTNRISNTIIHVKLDVDGVSDEDDFELDFTYPVDTQSLYVGALYPTIGTVSHRTFDYFTVSKPPDTYWSFPTNAFTWRTADAEIIGGQLVINNDSPDTLCFGAVQPFIPLVYLSCYRPVNMFGGGGATEPKDVPPPIIRPIVIFRDQDITELVRRARTASENIENLRIVGPGVSGNTQKGFQINQI